MLWIENGRINGAAQTESIRGTGLDGACFNGTRPVGLCAKEWLCTPARTQKPPQPNSFADIKTNGEQSFKRRVRTITILWRSPSIHLWCFSSAKPHGTFLTRCHESIAESGVEVEDLSRLGRFDARAPNAPSPVRWCPTTLAPTHPNHRTETEMVGALGIQRRAFL